MTTEQIERFRQGAVSPAEMLVLDDHFSTCDRCREMLSNQPPRSEWMRSQLESEIVEHLSYDELEAYVDSSGDETDREVIESHLQLCSDCSAQVEDLQRLKNSIAADRASFGGKVIFLWKSPEYSAPFRAASIAAVAALCALVLSLAFHRQDPSLEAKLKAAEQQSQKSREELRIAQTKLDSANLQLAQLQKPQEPSSEWIASLKDGEATIALDKKRNLIGAEKFPARYREIAKAAIQDQRISLPASIKELQGHEGVLMGEQDKGPAFRVLKPVGVVVESNRPEFQWEPLKGVTEYHVKVFDSNFNAVLSSAAISGNSWTADKDLPRNAKYVWKVTTMKDGQEISAPVAPAPQAMFRILEQSKADELQQIRNANSHLLAGLAYTEAGLIPEAQNEFQELLRANPDSTLAKNLLKSLNPKAKK